MVLTSANLASGLKEANEKFQVAEILVLLGLVGTRVSSRVAQLDLQDPE